MHQQIRVRPVKSPPDLEQLLEVLAGADVNIVAVGGGAVELGGEFAFAVEDDAAAERRRAGTSTHAHEHEHEHGAGGHGHGHGNDHGQHGSDVAGHGYGGQDPHHADDASEEDYVRWVADLLEKAGYKPRIVSIEPVWLDNRPGALLGAIRTASVANLEAGRIIQDVAIGVAEPDGTIPVQIFSTEVKVKRA